jgi:peptidoglycan/LPS O-acetylase OafA/YrhL
MEHQAATPKFSLVQVFRGIAAMLVVMYHLIANSTNHLGYVTYHNFFNFGFIGVDFFFVLSGFIITYIHFPDLMERKKNSIVRFFKKRILRIYPIYWVAAIVSVFIYYKITPVSMEEAHLKMDFTSPRILKFLAESFLLIDHDKKLRLVGVSWTLSYEMLFYIIFGIGIAIKFKYARIIAAIWLITIITLSFITPSSSDFIRFAFNVIIIEFLIGCVVAYIIRRKIVISNKILLPVLAITFILLLKTIHIKGLVFDRDIYNVLPLSLFFAIITYMAVRFDQKNSSFKFPAILILIGDASYSIYLFHNIFLSGFTRMYAKANHNFLSADYLPLVCTLFFFITIFLGVLIHLFIEKNILKYLNNLFFNKKNQIAPQTL